MSGYIILSILVIQEVILGPFFLLALPDSMSGETNSAIFSAFKGK